MSLLHRVLSNAPFHLAPRAKHVATIKVFSQHTVKTRVLFSLAIFSPLPIKLSLAHLLHSNLTSHPPPIPRHSSPLPLTPLLLPPLDRPIPLPRLHPLKLLRQCPLPHLSLLQKVRLLPLRHSRSLLPPMPPHHLRGALFVCFGLGAVLEPVDGYAQAAGLHFFGGEESAGFALGGGGF